MYSKLYGVGEFKYAPEFSKRCGSCHATIFRPNISKIAQISVLYKILRNFWRE